MRRVETFSIVGVATAHTSQSASERRRAFETHKHKASIPAFCRLARGRTTQRIYLSQRRRMPSTTLK